jgi:hypothetical protein
MDPVAIGFLIAIIIVAIIARRVSTNHRDPK